MSRLTKKVDGKYYPIMNQYGYDNVRRDIYNKLGELEDIEDELGCPLDVVFKALKDGIIDEENSYRAESNGCWTTRGYEITMQEHKLLNELFICWGGYR